MNCNGIVEKIYTHPDFVKSVSKIPPDIRDDIKQEIAINLLEQPCEKIASLYAEDNLIRYVIKMTWLMSTSKNNNIFKKYRAKDYKAFEYIQTLLGGSAIPESFALVAKCELDKKATGDIHTDHEARIFNKFVELGSGRKVAEYYGVPINHVCSIISKVKSELRCLLQP